MNHPTCALLSALAFTPYAFAQTQSTAPAAPPTQLQGVVVTGRTASDPVRKDIETEQAATPGAVTVLDGEGLRQRNVTSLADALRYVPGLFVASGSTGDATFYSSRGSNLDATNYDGNGIKLLVDGLPVTGADGNNHNRDVDPLSARYAIVARGANALTYGASTLGGAIDFITPTARDSAVNEVLINGGSHGQRQARATMGGHAGAFDGLVTVEGKRSDGYREHQRQRRSAVYANAGWQIDERVQTRFYVTAIDNKQQLPGALTRDEWADDPKQAQAAAAAGDYQYNVKTWRLANKTTWQIDADTKLSAGLSYERQKLFHPIVYSPPYFSLLIDTEQRNAGATLRYERRVGTHGLLLGLNYARMTVKGSNDSYTPSSWTQTPFTTVDNQADSLELFAMDRWQFASGWTAVYGAQVVNSSRDIRNTSVPGGALLHPSGDYDAVNPRAGLIRQLTPDIQVFTNLSRLYEAPTTFELQDDARGDGSALAAMRGVVAEIGTRGTHTAGRHRWHWETALYYGRLRNEILSRDDPDAPGTSLSMNAGRTIHAGLEALVGASLAVDATGTHRIEPLVNLTLNHFKFRGDRVYGHGDLPAAPKYAVKGEVLYRHASGFFAGPTFDVIGRRWADFSNTYQVDAYTLWGLRAGLGGKGWEAYVEGRNLGDKAHVSQFSVRDRAAAGDAILSPGEPRSVYVGARLTF
ncbi:TonB-dependent receptor family protein [Roseateles amylovorans]|uniref:TonB-dependent receptor n=1 Tax=Roseateles amylovorans TaxID=2978473 RepID=A0ABY6AZZ0_9BURK|nr:TonB-dependent receptor [Roseateles amylovorans]UXH78257.1 TonB-dependent receptor [Roseateles amylovorans]